MRTNFYGTCALTDALLPLLRASPSARLVNVASMAGQLNQIAPPLHGQQRFADEQTTLASIHETVADFSCAVAARTHK